MTWTVETWGRAVDAEIAELSAYILAKLARFRRKIETHGPTSLPMPHARYLGDALWELRLSGRDGIARVIYITVTEKRVILLRAFVKKTQRTPPREIALAKQRMRMMIL